MTCHIVCEALPQILSSGCFWRRSRQKHPESILGGGNADWETQYNEAM